MLVERKVEQWGTNLVALLAVSTVEKLVETLVETLVGKLV